MDKRVTVQRICGVCRDEEVVEVLNEIWKTPKNAVATINRVAARNRKIFELEHRLGMPTNDRDKIEAPVVYPETSPSQGL